MRGNCILWALYMWCRYGGYFALRRSRWGPFPHALWSRDLVRWYGFAPVDPRKRLIPPPWFRGRIKREIPVLRNRTNSRL